MSSSLNEDQGTRNTTGMEESSAMTIEFLRARLLSERSVSKSARQRADELSKRVAELEEELMFVSLQRKKAEKATADVLAILENRGISDLSEEFDSNSDRDESSHDFKSSNGSLMIKETSANLKPINNEGEVYSSSEIESSPSTGRSLSWKSTKDSQHSLEKKKYMESVRRRASFVSGGSSARRVGKSCRRIRRRETRSMNELQNDGTEKTSCSVDASNCSDGEPTALTEGSGKGQAGRAAEGSQNEAQKINGHYYIGHERDEDMESALQHQAQLIGRYEEEEKAQREWEEKFRESNNCTQESCDPGNHSDVTEERYEIEAPKQLCVAGATNYNNQEMKQDQADDHFGEEPQTSKNSSIPTDADKASLQDEKDNGCLESSASDFSFPMTKEKADHEFSEASGFRREQCIPVSSTPAHPSANNASHVEKKAAPFAAPLVSSCLDLAVVPLDTSNNLGSVLEALQRAKSSLSQQINSTALSTGHPSNPDTLIADNFKFPMISSGLFRLPTDALFEGTLQSSHGNFHPEIASSRFLSEPIVNSKSALSGNAFYTAPHRSVTHEIWSGAPPQRSFSQPRFNLGSSTFSGPNHPADTYPYLPDIPFHLPLHEEGTSRIYPGSESGLPPITRASSFFDQFRPNVQNR